MNFPYRLLELECLRHGSFLRSSKSRMPRQHVWPAVSSKIDSSKIYELDCLLWVVKILPMQGHDSVRVLAPIQCKRISIAVLYACRDGRHTLMCKTKINKQKTDVLEVSSSSKKADPSLSQRVHKCSSDPALCFTHTSAFCTIKTRPVVAHVRSVCLLQNLQEGRHARSPVRLERNMHSRSFCPNKDECRPCLVVSFSVATKKKRRSGYVLQILEDTYIALLSALILLILPVSLILLLETSAVQADICSFLQLGHA